MSTSPGESSLRLSRSAGAGRAAAPVRMAHLGLGSFFRAHQAWYTDRAPDAHRWGIAAFTGRRATLADAMAAQDGLYTLVTRRANDDQFEVISSVTEAHPAADNAAWLRCLRSPDLAVVTVTVTEAGYLRRPDGTLDTDDPQVQHDVATLRVDPFAPVATAPARLLAGLIARDRADLSPITVVPCDNLPDNGDVMAQAVRAMAELVHPRHVDAVERTASFATSMVDRITPATTRSDLDVVHEATHLVDVAPVVTEPFSEWVIDGEFPAGRPRWEEVGARLVTDVAPFTQRKLALLNGGHSLLAYAGSIRGHTTVAEAVADPICRRWLNQWWDEAEQHLPFPQEQTAAYRAALLERFANPRIAHPLAQIAVDGSEKLRVRILPTLRAHLARGRMPSGATGALAAWICHLRGYGVPVRDVHANAATRAAAGPITSAVPGVLALIDPDLSEPAVVATITTHVESLIEQRSPAAP